MAWAKQAWQKAISLDWLAPERHEGWPWMRVAFALSALATWLPRATHLEETYSSAGIVISAGRVPLTEWIVFSPRTVWLVWGALIAGLLLVALARLVRPGLLLFTAGALALCFTEGLNMKAYDRLLLWQGFALFLAPAAGARVATGSPAARYALLLIYAGLYGSTGWNKVLGDPRWWRGIPLAYDFLDLNFGGRALGIWLSTKMFLVAPMAWVTLIFESTFPVLVWSRRVRPYLLATAGMFHFFVMITMNVNTFSVVAVSAYPAMLDPATFVRLRGFALRALGRTAPSDVSGSSDAGSPATAS